MNLAYLVVQSVGAALAAFTAHPCSIDGKPVDMMKYQDILSAPKFAGAIVCKGSDGKIYEQSRYKNGVQIASVHKSDAGDTVRQQEAGGETTLRLTKFPDGKTKTEVRRGMGLMNHGYQREFDESGTKIKEELFDHGQLLKAETFYLNGQTKETMEAKFTKDGDAIRVFREYYDNGKLRASRRTHYYQKLTGYGKSWTEDNDGIEETFDENGLPVSYAVWKNGLQDGVSKTYHRHSRALASESHFKAGYPFREKEFLADGTLTRDDELFKDGSRKAHIKPAAKK